MPNFPGGNAGKDTSTMPTMPGGNVGREDLFGNQEINSQVIKSNLIEIAVIIGIAVFGVVFVSLFHRRKYRAR